jgi:short-chain fatty acids transporter
MATPSSIPSALLKISGVIPISHTFYTWQSLTTAGILMVAGVSVAYLFAPATSEKTAESFGVIAEPKQVTPEQRRTPAEYLEYAPVLSHVIGALGLA